MAEMSQEIMDLINGDGFCYLATASNDGISNMAIFGSTTATSPDTIIMTGAYLEKTYHNLLANPKAAVIIHSSLPPERTKASLADCARACYAQVKGSVSIHTSGDIHEQAKSTVAKSWGPDIFKYIKVTYVLNVEEIYSAGLGPWGQIKGHLARFI